MNKPITKGRSLLERAAEIYDFSSGLRLPPEPRIEPRPAPEPRPAAMQAESMPVEVPSAETVHPGLEPKPLPRRAIAPIAGRSGQVDREALEAGGFILPASGVTGLAEEFRIVKRQLLLGARGATGLAEDKRQSILVCSARPGEGKTFCAVNLALSLALEKDVDVLLVDGDFTNPEILSVLGLEDGPGLIDAIADPSVDPDAYVIGTDLDGLSVLPAGRSVSDATELLASARTREVLASLTRGRPDRIVIFDSPPALMASPASVLAALVGQVMMVVRADETSESDLREAIGLLSGCDSVSLLLNAASLAASGRRFGSYYGAER
jgi:exopolysaccharide/PEP-CTERM locus tyrosine autokinase